MAAYGGRTDAGPARTGTTTATSTSGSPVPTLVNENWQGSGYNIIFDPRTGQYYAIRPEEGAWNLARFMQRGYTNPFVARTAQQAGDFVTSSGSARDPNTGAYGPGTNFRNTAFLDTRDYTNLQNLAAQGSWQNLAESLLQNYERGLGTDVSPVYGGTGRPYAVNQDVRNRMLAQSDDIRDLATLRTLAGGVTKGEQPTELAAYFQDLINPGAAKSQYVDFGRGKGQGFVGDVVGGDLGQAALKDVSAADQRDLLAAAYRYDAAPTLRSAANARANRLYREYSARNPGELTGANDANFLTWAHSQGWL